MSYIPFGAEQEFGKLAEQLGLDADRIEKLAAFLGKEANNSNAEELLDAPFRRKLTYK